MPRQPYSVAVKSDGEERLHPLPFWKGRGLGSGLRTPSSQEGDREVENALINGKEGRVGFRKNFFARGGQGSRKNKEFLIIPW